MTAALQERFDRLIADASALAGDPARPAWVRLRARAVIVQCHQLLAEAHDDDGRMDR